MAKIGLASGRLAWNEAGGDAVRLDSSHGRKPRTCYSCGCGFTSDDEGLILSHNFGTTEILDDEGFRWWPKVGTSRCIDHEVKVAHDRAIASPWEPSDRAYRMGPAEHSIGAMDKWPSDPDGGCHGLTGLIGWLADADAVRRA